MLSYDSIIIKCTTVESNYCVTFKYIFKCSNVSNNLDPTTTPPFCGTKNTCYCSLKHATLKDINWIWITWHRRGEAICPGHNVHFTITLLLFISWREKYWLYFNLKAIFWLFWLDIPLSLTHLHRCVSDYVCFRVCANNIRPTLPLIGLPWHFTFYPSQSLPLMWLSRTHCPLTKEEQ